ncbi:MAG: hypothetical protein J0H67_11570 [Rhodospirillales bacterium]|nr:hypothetical protein [Rhodospirillales bacterium]
MRFVILVAPLLLALGGCVSVYGEKEPENRATIVTPPPASGAPVVVTRP